MPVVNASPSSPPKKKNDKSALNSLASKEQFTHLKSGRNSFQLPSVNAQACECPFLLVCGLVVREPSSISVAACALAIVILAACVWHRVFGIVWCP